MSKKQSIVVAFLAGVFLYELVILAATGFCLSNRPANAAQRFTPETVKSVPKSFLEGGDRTLTALTEINTTLRENGRKLDMIAEKLDKLNASLERVLKDR